MQIPPNIEGKKQYVWLVLRGVNIMPADVLTANADRTSAGILFTLDPGRRCPSTTTRVNGNIIAIILSHS